MFTEEVRDDFIQLVNLPVKDSLHIMNNLGNCTELTMLEESSIIERWLHEVKSSQRRLKFIEAWKRVAFSDKLSQDIIPCLAELLFWILQYQVKGFLEEIYLLSHEDFLEVCSILKTLNASADLHVGDRYFHLTHWLGDEHVPQANHQRPL